MCMEGNQFYQALNRLMNDSGYRTTIVQNPKQLVEDYRLTRDDLQLIAEVRKAAVKEDPDVQGYTWEDNLGDITDWLNEYLCCA